MRIMCLMYREAPMRTAISHRWLASCITFFSTSATGKKVPSSLFPRKNDGNSAINNSWDAPPAACPDPSAHSHSLRIPSNAAHKVCTPSDAVSLISRGDTICVSGFAGQGSPDLILKALADRYQQEYEEGVENGLGDLAILFGGGPGDWQSRGLNYLARIPHTDEDDGTRDAIQAAGEESGENDLQKGDVAPPKPMVKRAIGAHFAQVPMLGALATSNQIEAWTLPMGSISRMIRAQATHSPGHITTVGLGTYVDPTPGVGNGGAVNQLALESPLHNELVTKVSIGFGPEGDKMKTDYLMYKALPIQVAIIRATTADSSGNLSFEHESLLCDQRNVAMAARNSGGVVLAQVKRLCAVGSLPSRSVGVPGAMVDCVVVVDEAEHAEYHPMSYTRRHDPVLSGEIKTPVEDIPRMPLDERKIIARRASYALEPGKVVNLGIGLPEGIASVAGEEGQLPYVTLTTEPGVFGGLPSSGSDFGPSANADGLVEMNQMFDFYDGGGLDMCFLGAAQVSAKGDVNVSRMSQDRLTGPGGFIDISQSTRNISFLCTFTTKGLDIAFDGENGRISIVEDGKIKKFVNKVKEVTFSGDEAVRRGQKVFYVTERAVFRRTASHDVLELIEIAPGIDLQRDILDQMEFRPIVSTNLLMDKRIFLHQKMDMELFGSLADRCKYRQKDHVLFIDLFGISLASEAEIEWFVTTLDRILKPITEKSGPVDVIVNYDGFDLRSGLEDKYSEVLAKVEQKHYRSVKRFSGKAFRLAELRKKSNVREWDANALFQEMDEDGDGKLNCEELRRGVRKALGIKLKQAELDYLCKVDVTLDNFTETMGECLRNC